MGKYAEMPAVNAKLFQYTQIISKCAWRGIDYMYTIPERPCPPSF